MLTLMLLLLAGSLTPATDDTPDTAPAVVSTAPTCHATTWSALKVALTAAPVLDHDSRPAR